MYRPALRAEVAAKIANDSTVLQDPLTGWRIPIDPIMRSLLLALDGTRTVEELLTAVTAQHPEITHAAIEEHLRDLLLLGLLDGAAASARDKLSRLHSGALDPAPVMLPGSRFACQGSGACCHGYSFGPLSDEDVSKIEALDIAAGLPQLAEKDYLEVIEWHGERATFHLATVDDHCVFLLADQRCGLHAAFGEAVKPGFCRLFPIQAARTIDGLRLYDAGACATFAVSGRSGPPLESELDRLLPLVNRRAFYHPRVRIQGEICCDHGYLLQFQRAAIERAARAASAGDALASTARLARAFVSGLVACPIAPGEPDATLARILADPPPVIEIPDGKPLADLAAEVRAALAPVALRDRPSSLVPRRFRDALEHLEALVRHGTAPPGAGLVVDSDEEELLQRSMAQVLFGKKLLIDDRLDAGLLRLALMQAAAPIAARLVAHEERAPRVTDSHWSYGHMLAARSLNLPPAQRALVAHRGAAWEAMLAAALL